MEPRRVNLSSMHLSIREESLAHIQEAQVAVDQVPSNSKRERVGDAMVDPSMIREEIEKLGNVTDNWSLLREILKSMLPPVVQDLKKKVK